MSNFGTHLSSSHHSFSIDVKSDICVGHFLGLINVTIEIIFAFISRMSS
jgi:hypothetical protein